MENFNDNNSILEREWNRQKETSVIEGRREYKLD